MNISVSVATDLISVVMPCYNGAENITASVRSVLDQSYPQLELIVVDDGSQDNSLELLQQLAREDQRLRVYQQQNSGAGPARNHALRKARGSWIAFLDADDYWDPDCLQKLHAAAVAAGADMAYCGWQNVGLSGGQGEPFVPPDYARTDRAELLLGGNRWPIHGILSRREVIDSVDGFDERWTSCMDYDLWLHTAPFHAVVRVPEVLAFYRHHGGVQITGNRVRVALNHWRVQQKFLHAHPEISSRLGKKRIRELTYGYLLGRGYRCYWNRDLKAARPIFRKVMAGGYGTLRDWKYMLPSLLPMPLHRALIAVLGRDKETAQ